MLISHSREPSTSSERENLFRQCFLWATVLVRDCHWILCLAMDLEKRPCFSCKAPLWFVLIQEDISLNEKEDQRFISFLQGVLEAVTKKGCLKKRVWLWNLLRRYLKVLQGKASLVTVQNQSISHAVSRLVSYETSPH